MVTDFNKKGNREFFSKNLLYRTVGIIFLAFIFVLIVADFKIYQKKRELTAQINSYQKQIEDIKKNSQTLKEEIANSDNKDYLEKLGYEQLNQTRPGEIEYMFVNSPQKSETAPKPESSQSWTAWLSNTWQQTCQWIKNKF